MFEKLTTTEPGGREKIPFNFIFIYHIFFDAAAALFCLCLDSLFTGEKETERAKEKQRGIKSIPKIG